MASSRQASRRDFSRRLDLRRPSNLLRRSRQPAGQTNPAAQVATPFMKSLLFIFAPLLILPIAWLNLNLQTKRRPKKPHLDLNFIQMRPSRNFALAKRSPGLKSKIYISNAHELGCPPSNPFLNHVIRCFDEPCVNESGVTRP